MYISIDLGGTSTRVASSHDLKIIHNQEKFDTEKSFELQKQKLAESIKEVSQAEKIDGVCIGVPGLIDRENKKFGFIVNVPYLSNLPYLDLLGDKFKEVRIFVENDAGLAGLGEAAVGAGVNHAVVVYLTLSTGVGGVRIVEKQLDPYQKFSEPGHMIIQKDGRLFEKCGQKGCFSAYCSGTAFQDLYGESPIICKDRDIWKDYAKHLSIGITNIISVWSPDIIVLGGSVSKKYDEYFKIPLLAELNSQTLFKVPYIVHAKLGDEAGLRGGFVLLSQNISSHII